MELTPLKRRSTWLPLGSLFLLALGIRLLYLWAALDNLGLDRFWNYAPDTNVYYAVKSYFLGWHLLGDYSLFRVGPGYGLLLAGLDTLFGSSPMVGILFNIMLGSLAPGIIFLLALQLVESRAVAWIAGLITALSHTSIALSCHLLTDQPYFTLHAASLLFFVLGFKRGKSGWFILAGCIASIATLIRPSGQFWPILFFIMAVGIPLFTMRVGRTVMIRKALLTGLIMTSVVLGWSARNYAHYGEFTFGSNGVFSLKGAIVAQVMSEHHGKKVYDYRQEWGPDHGINPGQHVKAYQDAKARTSDIIRDHPSWILSAALRNMNANSNAPNYYVARQIPSLEAPMSFIGRQMELWGGYLLTLLSIASLILLFIRRKYQAWILLGTTYLYFTLIIGLSFWQGSRLHYPAEMAWSVLIPFLLVNVCRMLSGRITGRRRTTQAISRLQ